MSLPVHDMDSSPASRKKDPLLARAAGMGTVLLLVFLWSHWSTLVMLAERWSQDPQYSHGFLVPLFALVVLWFRKDQLSLASWQPTFWGLPLLVVGIALHLFAVRWDIVPLEGFTLLPTLFGLVL